MLNTEFTLGNIKDNAFNSSYKLVQFNLTHNYHYVVVYPPGSDILPSVHFLLFHLISSCRIVIVMVNSKLLKRHSKAKRRAPAYSRALPQIRGVIQRMVRGRLRSGCQRVGECVKSEGFSKE